MASSGKFDLSSSGSSQGRGIYNSGKRGSQTVTTMDRSASFRDNMENPVLSSLPSMSRTSLIVSQGDVTNFFQCLRFDLKSMAGEYKCNRHGDFKRLANAALCAPDDSPSALFKGKLPFSSPENLKRLKVGLRESTIKARERVKVFSEVLSVINKCFPFIPSRKRSRPDTFSTAFDFEQQNVEERGKNVIPNKRTRVSMVGQRADVRPNTPARSSGSVALPVIANGWEKTKMKKKRTVIKVDMAKPIDSSIMHPRNLSDARSKSNFISGTPSSTTKLHAVARGPRSGSGSAPVPKLIQSQHQTVSNGLTLTNRKRDLSTRSSSPPVAQWAERRPQKISRTARRTHLIPLIPTNDEIVPKRYPANSPKQFKSKGDYNMQSSTPLESEESGAAEVRTRGSFKSVEVEDKDDTNVQKMSPLVIPVRNNKFMNDKKHRKGRGFSSVRSFGNVGTEKQLRTGRVGFDKAESKIGRPPTRKLSGRKAYTRQKHSAFTAATDFLDDGHEELLAAANAVINPVYALSNPFWSQTDPLFSFVSDAAVTYLKQEGSIRSTVNITKPIDHCDTKKGTESISEWPENLTSPKGVSLCQRLLAALISEEDNNDELNYNVYGSAFDPETTDIIGGSFSSSYTIDSTLRSCSEVASSQCQYSNFSIDERLLIEIHNLGIYPSHVPDLVQSGDEDISKDIRRLAEKHHKEVSRKKSILDKLLKSTEEARELHEKEFERLSLEKLTELAYHKYMSCWGKSASGKMAKQAASDFVKRTLNRCHEFQTTGKSCFSEPLFKDIFHSGLSHLNYTEIDDFMDDHSRKVDGSTMEKTSGTQVSPMLNNHDMYLSEQTIAKDNVWSSRSKNRELCLDDVAAAGMTCTSSSGVGRVIINSVKGKRSERDGGPKVGRPAKTKAKLKQKTTQLSSSVNGSLGKVPEQKRSISSFDPELTINEKDESMVMEEEPLDLSHLQLPEMVDFGGQGEDIGSWLNIDDDVFPHDDDFMGLEIPMDDLTDLNMMV